MAESEPIARRQPGEVRDAIVRVLQSGGGPMPIAAIHESVAELLEGQVQPSSVRSYLRLNSGPSDRFKRVTRGVYTLR